MTQAAKQVGGGGGAKRLCLPDVAADVGIYPERKTSDNSTNTKKKKKKK